MRPVSDARRDASADVQPPRRTVSRMDRMLHQVLGWVHQLRHRIAGTAPPEGDFAALERDFIRKTVCPGFEWVERASPSPLILPEKPLEDCRVALVSTAGIYLKGQRPFSFGLQGDASFRVIPAEVEASELRVRHPGYDVSRARKNLNCVFPWQHLSALGRERRIGGSARRHYSFMGFALNTDELEQESIPEIAQLLVADQVDFTLLCPA